MSYKKIYDKILHHHVKVAIIKINKEMVLLAQASIEEKGPVKKAYKFLSRICGTSTKGIKQLIVENRKRTMISDHLIINFLFQKLIQLRKHAPYFNKKFTLAINVVKTKKANARHPKKKVPRW
jgi:hypothetical protein